MSDMSEVVPGAPVSAPDSTDGGLKGLHHAAVFVFGCVILLAFATVLLNRRMADQAGATVECSDQLRRLRRMVSKLHAYQAGGGILIEGVLLTAFQSDPLLRDIQPWDWDNEGPVASALYYDIEGQVSVSPLRGQSLYAASAGIRAFAAKAGPLLKQAAPDSALESKLAEEASETIREPGLARLVRDKLHWLARLQGRSHWRDIVGWVCFDWWPPTGSFGSAGSGISYNRTDDPKSLRFDQDLMLRDHLMLARTPEEAENIIEEQGRDAYAKFLAADGLASTTSLSAFGLSMRVDDLVALAGPLLLAGMAIFFIYWSRLHTVTSGGQGTGALTAFVFPIYTSTPDPLRPQNRPLTLSNAVERVIWLMFLTLPIILVAVGIVTRFDLSTRFESAVPLKIRTPWLLSVIESRAQDTFSAVVDIQNLLCLIGILWISFRITADDSEKGRVKLLRRQVWGARFVAECAVVIAVMAVPTLRVYVGHSHAARADLAFLSLFFLLWPTAWILAVNRRTVTMRVLSLVVMASVAALCVM